MQNRQRAVRLDMAWLRRFAASAREACERSGGDRRFALRQIAEVEIAIVSDRVIAEVHRRFMAIRGATDVITFEHGEIVMSAQTAQACARALGHSVEEELALYTVHGLLHLNGYDDAPGRAAARMHKAQKEVLQACFAQVPPP